MKITCITASCNTKTNIDLYFLAKYLNLGHIHGEIELVSIKYAFAQQLVKRTLLTTPQKVTGKKSFLNQCTLALRVGGGIRNVSVKVFSNGIFHYTGLKFIKEAVDFTQVLSSFFVSCIDGVEHSFDILGGSGNVLLTESEKLVLNPCNLDIIGHYIDGDGDRMFYLNVAKEYFVFDTLRNVFVAREWKKKVKRVYSVGGEYVGVDTTCYYTSKKKDGFYVFKVQGGSNEVERLDGKKILHMSRIGKEIGLDNVRTHMINSSLFLELPIFGLDLHEFFKSINLHSYYDPSVNKSVRLRINSRVLLTFYRSGKVACCIVSPLL